MIVQVSRWPMIEFRSVTSTPRRARASRIGRVLRTLRATVVGERHPLPDEDRVRNGATSKGNGFRDA
jgi:hypothetical protein